jgi:murein L,D-transpeptidase YafK
MGDKLMHGDRATPEGIYRVIDKKNGVKTRYYKALLINYPNESDKARYYNAIRSGVLSKKTSIGGLIEIHGDGGRGINWTEGCIALENRLMDTVFDLCQINTPVIIVGSDKPMEEYFN